MTVLDVVDDVMENSDLQFQMNLLPVVVQMPMDSNPAAVEIKNEILFCLAKINPKRFNRFAYRFVLCAHIIEKSCVGLMMPIQR